MANTQARRLRLTSTDAERRLWVALRFWNNNILANPEGVQEVILQALTRQPSPSR